MAECVNDAVVEAHTNGVLTSASLLVNGAAFDDAVAKAKRNPSLAVGLHLALVRSRAALSRPEIPNLVDGEGFFFTNATDAGMRYFFSAKLRPELEAEIRAQLDKFLATGLRLDHVDGHLNIHVHPTVLSILIQLSDEYRIPALRIPDQPWLWTMRNHPERRISKTLHAITFAPLARRAKKMLRGRFGFADRVHGNLESGNVHEAYLAKLLEELPDGLTEIYLHPAKSPCPEYRRWNPDYEGESELKALTNTRIRDLIRQRSIELVTYGTATGD